MQEENKKEENKMSIMLLGSKRYVIGVLVVMGMLACHSHPVKKRAGILSPVPGLKKTDRKGSELTGELIRSQYKPGELISLCKKAIQDATLSLDAIGRLEPKDRTIDHTLLAAEKVVADLNDAAQPMTFMGYVSTDQAISAEGSQCEEALASAMVGVFSRKDVYQSIQDSNPLNAPRNSDEKRLLSETLKLFENNGLKLSDEKLAQVTELNQKLSGLQVQFSTNLNADTSAVEFGEEELAGVPTDFLSGLKRAKSGKYILTTKETDYVQVMETASISETRRKMLFAYVNRAADKNTQLLEQAIGIRQQIAPLMGWKSWAEFRINGRMAKDADTVLKFLNGLKDKLAVRNQSDLAKLLAFKKELDSSAVDLKAWDTTYLAYQLKKRDYGLDDEKIRQYFPAEIVIKGLFEVYSKLLSVNYIELKDAAVWASDVKLYRIENAKDGRLIGFFYTDFFPRPGKYGHAAAFPLISARTLTDGSYSKPVAAIVANISAPANGKPALLNHSEVETIFHEFGHIMHQTLTLAPYASLSGSSVAQDFVEAPSQMLENWVWSPEVLASVSGNYLNPQEKLPQDLLQKMVQAKEFNQGSYYTRQLMLALLDMTYHTATGPVNTTEIYDRMTREVMGVEPVAGGHFAASFGHLMGGYDAGYYGYLWSEVYAADMFTRFQAKGLLNPEVGMSYRHEILEKGNMVGGLDLLRGFLGREPNSDAFFKKLHI